MLKAAWPSTWKLNSSEPWSLYSVSTCNSVRVLSKGSSIFHFIGWLKFWLELSLARCPTHRIVPALSWKISLSMHQLGSSVSRSGPGSSVSFHRWPFVNHMSFFKHRMSVFPEWAYQRLTVEARSHDEVWERARCHGLMMESEKGPSVMVKVHVGSRKVPFTDLLPNGKHIAFYFHIT